MGYYSRFSGELTVRRKRVPKAPTKAMLARAKDKGVEVEDLPAASDKALAALKALQDFSYYFEYEEGWDGVDILRRTGESGKAYTFQEELEAAVAILAADGLVVDGKILQVGEDGSEAFRYIVTENVVVTEKAKVLLQWPDGSQEELPRA